MNYVSQAIQALLLAAPVACVVWTLTQEELFRELREKLGQWQRRSHHLWQRKIAYLPTCPYCSSHYVAAVFVWLFAFKMLAEDWRGYVVSLFSVVLIANVYLTTYHLLRVLLRKHRALADQAEATSHRTRWLNSPIDSGRWGNWSPPISRQEGHAAKNLRMGNGQSQGNGHQGPAGKGVAQGDLVGRRSAR